MVLTVSNGLGILLFVVYYFKFNNIAIVNVIIAIINFY